MKTNSNPQMFRQGDVGIIPQPIPADAVKKLVKGRLVLAWGEVTGHAHAICEEAVEAGDVECYEKDGVTYLRVVKPSDLKHEEHAKVDLPPGDYRVFIQREYSPAGERKVVD